MLIGPYGSLCVLMDSNKSVWDFIRLYASLRVLISPVRPYVYFRVLVNL